MALSHLNCGARSATLDPLTVPSIMEAAIQELRHAARRLARTPGFTLIALATLSLAIGASTAVKKYASPTNKKDL